jgi:rRNA-processing protein FCF1
MHYEKLKEVLEKQGGNVNLLNLFLGEGTADIMMIAYILAEKEADKSWFPEEYVIITKDSELTRVAKSYGITCLDKFT